MSEPVPGDDEPVGSPDSSEQIARLLMVAAPFLLASLIFLALRLFL